MNRVLVLLPDSKFKVPIIALCCLVLISSSIVPGFVLANSPLIYTPLFFFLLVVIGEIRRALIRRLCAGSPPIDTIPHEFKLTSPVTTMTLITHRYRVPHRKWNGPPLRIVHLTDLHVNPYLPFEYYQEVILTAEQSKPDIAIFTGDFITHVEALPMLAKILQPIAKLGTYAVLGNHDYWENADAVRDIITKNGIQLLSDETMSFVSGENKIAITGHDYPWGKKEKRIPNQQEDTLHLVLSHTPDNIYRLSEASADFVFSGHYHAGQIRIPFIGPIIIPSIYGRRFDHGHFVVNGTHLFVASGVGAANPPVRLYCHPDIFVVDIISEEQGSGTLTRFAQDAETR